MTKKSDSVGENAATYPVEALAMSKAYADRRDAVVLALNPDEQYTKAEADAKIEKFLSHVVIEQINKKG